MSLYTLASCVLFGLSGAAFAGALCAVAVPPPPRLGRRGAQRQQALDANGLFAAAEPFIRHGGVLLENLPLAGLRRWQDRQLKRADYALGLSADEYSALSIISAVALAAVGLALSPLTRNGWLFVVSGGLLGGCWPTLQIQDRVRLRAKQIARGLPHAIEIAAMCMSAGLDFTGALRLISQPSAGKRHAVAQEFSMILEEIELGHTRREALLSFAARVPTPAVRDFTNAVIQADQKGSPLAKVLQVQGRMLNMRRSVAAEEAAARAAVLMVLPILLLVGCIVLLLMGPMVVTGGL